MQNIEIVFLRNGLTGGGLGMMNIVQANYFYHLGFDVTIIVDQSFSEDLLLSKNAKMLDPGIKIIFGLTSNKYLSEAPQVKRKSKKEQWFMGGGTVSSYFDEYGVLIKKAYHDIDKQRVKIEMPIVEQYFSGLKEGDIVIAMEASLGWYLGYLDLPHGVAKIFQHHNQHFYLSQWIDNSHLYDAIVFQTAKTQEAYEEIYGKKNNCSIIGNPLRINIPDNISPHIERPLKIIVVGRLAEGKQPIDAIKAFESIVLKVPGSYLEFYGSGPLEDEIQKYIQENNLEGKVFLKGHESDISKIFSDASLMLFPTKRESFGLVILEAYSFGVPVIAYSTVFGVDDLITTGKDGYIVEQGDLLEMSIRGIELLLDPLKRDQFANISQAKVEEYEYNKIMQKHFNLIEKVSSVIIDPLSLKENYFLRKKVPIRLLEYINKLFDYDEKKKIYTHLEESNIKIVDARAIFYSKELIEKYNIPLELLDINAL